MSTTSYLTRYQFHSLMNESNKFNKHWLQIRPSKMTTSISSIVMARVWSFPFYLYHHKWPNCCLPSYHTISTVWQCIRLSQLHLNDIALRIKHNSKVNLSKTTFLNIFKRKLLVYLKLHTNFSLFHELWKNLEWLQILI